MVVLFFTLLFLLYSGDHGSGHSTAPSARYIVDLTESQLTGFRRELGDDLILLEKIHHTTTLYRLEVRGSFPESRLDLFRDQGLLNQWQTDKPVTPRNIPNDPLYSEQWDMDRIGMPEAWNQATGGVTLNGDTIVVAILDTGFETDHEDLALNIWRNHGEIPGDGIDNDQNGYTDDYLGLNVQTDNDQHASDVHGTAVAGIIGAQGGNQKGVCGINWNVKLLLISGIERESDIIEGYQYATALRNTYRNSGGTQGAFVVATSLSAGIDNAFPEQHQLWCDQYNVMGNAGILSICATTNANANVDVSGDMPTTCPSEYMVAVTNTGKNDQKLMFAGYGKIHVDLGAPGTPTLTTDLSNSYDEFEGTSAAAPHVSGAVALLYSVACSDVLALAQSNPGMLARQMRALIIDNVDTFTGLEPITVSGGRLNVAGAMSGLLEICGNTGGKLEILLLAPNPAFNTTRLEYSLPDLRSHAIHIYDNAGRLLRDITPSVSIPGMQSIDIDLKSFPPGVYHIAILQGDEVTARSLLVQ